MRICHIVPSLEERHGGPSKSVFSLSRAIARAGHEVELLTTAPDAPETGSEATDGSLRVRTFRRDFPQRFRPSAGMVRALKCLSPDVVHHHALWLRTLDYAHRCSLRSGAPLVISPRGMMSTWAMNHHAWRKRIARALVHPGAFEAAVGWHATSTEEEKDILTHFPGRKTCVAPNGVDAPSATDLEAARTFWVKECPEVGSRPTALFYGRFHQKKRVIELIDLWLEQAPGDWLLLLVGLPEQFSVEDLESYVLRQSGANRVRVFNGAGRPSPYAVSSLFLLPSHSENFGLTVAEAMAHGVPAVVTDATPWSGLNTDERGWCVPWDEFGAAMQSACAEGPAALSSRGERARTWVVAEFSWDRAARKLVTFYESLVRR
jgi:glycosyltransferase involved in cell wall biosynthesis